MKQVNMVDYLLMPGVAVTARKSNEAEGYEMLKVIDLATRSGATPHAIRYYTRMGLLRPRRNPDNGYRLYEYREVSWLTFIRQALPITHPPSAEHFYGGLIKAGVPE